MGQHRQGTGSRLCQVAKQRNIRFCLAELLRGDQALERRIKFYKNSKKMCPICQKKLNKLTIKRIINACSKN